VDGSQAQNLILNQLRGKLGKAMMQQIKTHTKRANEILRLKWLGKPPSSKKWGSLGPYPNFFYGQGRKLPKNCAE